MLTETPLGRERNDRIHRPGPIRVMGGLGSGAPLETVVLLAIALGALAQSATGMGFSLIAAPGLIALDGPARGVATVLVLAVSASLVPFSKDWRHARPREAVTLLVPTLLCTPVVAWLLHGVDTRWLALGAGVGVLGGVALLGSGLRAGWLRRPWGAAITGLGSATLNVLGGVGGPPVGLYAANSDWDPPTTRGTLHAFFLVQNLVTAVVIGIAWPGWIAFGAVAVGAASGMVLAPRLPRTAARTGVLVVSLIGGAALLLGAA